MKTILQVVVVFSSVLLVSGFLAYRAGAFVTLFGPATNPDQLPPPGVSTAPTASQPDPTIMYSSKSIGPVFPPSPSGTSTAGQMTPTIMPGSKSAPIIFPLAPSSPPPAQTQSSAPQK